MPESKRKRDEHFRKCAFGGTSFFKDKEEHNPCDAAGGADCHLFTRCRSCSANGGNSLWVCLSCWDEIATKVDEVVEEKEGATRTLFGHNVLAALRGTDWCGLHEQAIEASKQRGQQARGALGPACPSHQLALTHFARAWQGPLNIGQPALVRMCEDGVYKPWVDWCHGCPFCYNPRFDAPPPPAPNPSATAQVLDGFPRTYRWPEAAALNDYGETVTRNVRAPQP